MNYIELEVVPAWRYCNVRGGEKIPYPAGWQRDPRRIKDIESDNVGLLLGPVSGGLVALDFDGASAWSWFDQRIGCALPPTVMWTSGKDSRCQMAFQVPAQYWDYVRTQKITHTRDDMIADGEGFEFRWTGCQSVVPPSQLADGRQYAWIASPAQTDVAELPDEILAHWLTLSDNHAVVNTNPVVDIDLDKVNEKSFNRVAELLLELKKTYTDLPYDDWFRIAFATASEIGNTAAAALLSTIWPEKVRGEYARLLASRDPGRSPTVKSLVFRLQEIQGREHSEKYKRYISEQNEIRRLERILEEKKHGRL